MIPHLDQFEKTIHDVFDLRSVDKVGIVFDVPDSSVNDSVQWADRRRLALDWFDFFTVLSKSIGFSVDLFSFDAVSCHNEILSENILNDLSQFSVVIALTEFSITSSLVRIAKDHADFFRCASMPGAERRMHESSYVSDYAEVKVYSHALRRLLTDACSAHIVFSTGDEFVVDLRNRDAGADDGDCTKPGSVINFPSGEGFIAPYEGNFIEEKRFGESRSKGVIPFMHQGALVKGLVKMNRFVSFDGPKDIVSSLDAYFDENPSRRNIAELGIGCNKNAQVTGNMFEDEKTGVHIAYGTSSHLGGKITSDVHYDLVFAKGCPVEATRVNLVFEDDSSIEIVKDSFIQYDLLGSLF
jgi:hypothetical protein